MTQTQTSPADITAGAVASFDNCPDERLRELMQALVRHLHAFTVDVGLTEEEWRGMIATLTATGHITDDRRQEFILWSDTLGLSMLVDAIANPLPEGATESTVLGPFYVRGSPQREYGESMEAEDEPAGVPAWVYGRVLSVDGAPIAGAEVDVWQNGDNELYAVQDPGAPEHHLRARFRTRTPRRYRAPYRYTDRDRRRRCPRYTTACSSRLRHCRHSRRTCLPSIQLRARQFARATSPRMWSSLPLLLHGRPEKTAFPDRAIDFRQTIIPTWQCAAPPSVPSIAPRAS